MKKSKILNRRQALILGGKLITASSLGLLGGPLVGCSNSFTSPTVGGGAKRDITSGTWASGGTDLITVNYPEDSIFSSESCSTALATAATLGPCYFRDTTGEDISLGSQGLPMQLCIRLVDSSCNPLQGYRIEVWHCDADGLYSGNTSESTDKAGFNAPFCTSNNSSALNSTWFRGMLTTDSSGRVNFKTCFPGWYTGRTIHIHFAVGNASGNRIFVSQFCFKDSLAYEICTAHSRYSHRGEQDKPLSKGQDTVFPANGYEEYLLNTKQNADGTLLAYHTIKLV